MPRAPRASARPRAAKLAAVGLVVALLGAAQAFHAFEALKDPAGLARSLAALGPRGYLIFILAYAALQPFGVPGTLFVMAAPLIWPWPVAFALSMVGTLAASAIGFAFARFVARDWVEAHLPPKFGKYEDALARRAFATVVLLRFVFWMPPLLHAFFGVSKVRGWTHFWGSLVGYAVPLFLVSYFGERLFVFMKTVPVSAWLLGAGVVAAAAVGTFAVRRLQARPR